ncbi:unnamed protein product [Penicillium olsonii]|nr:unnamed protein product [Penicillium olsonii]
MPGPVFPAIVGFIILWSLRAIYRAFLHPLAHFKGPPTAGISTWWLYLKSRGRKIELELKGFMRNMDAVFYAGFNAPHTAFTEEDPILHRQRRKLINPQFSKQGIASMQSLIDSKVDYVLQAISKFESRGAVHMHNAFRCLTVDVISEYSFYTSFDLMKGVKDETFEMPFLLAFDIIADSVLDFQAWPLFRKAINQVPATMFKALSQKARGWHDLVGTVQSAKERYQSSQSCGLGSTGRPAIFDSLKGLPSEAISAEALDIIIAGSDTTAMTLGVALYQILADFEISRRLIAELDEAIPDKDTNTDLIILEQLPYLTACVKEALRHAMPVPGRLPRIVPENGPPLIIDNHPIPPGTVVGMSAHSIHFDESIWGPDARSFRPERWLHPDAKQLDKYLVTFSKGARACAGINLAYAEIRIALAKLFRRLSISLDESMTPRDMEPMDCFTTCFEGTGVRIFIDGHRK